MKTKLKLVWIVLALLWPGLAQAEKDYPLWRLVAKSYLIVEATIDVPVAAIQKAEQTEEHEYVPVGLAVGRVLKGNSESHTPNFRYYTDSENYSGVSRKQIAQLNQRLTIVFLQKVREKYYLAAYAPETMQSANETLAARILKEVEIQEKQIQESDHYAAGNVLPMESELQSLIELMIDPRMDPAGSQEVNEALIGLGKEAIPALIKYMDDRRKLTIPKITLEPWWPDAFEGLVHYGPETVTDVLSVALMALTDESLTSIYNGGTELERQQAVRIWKIYERRTYGKPVTR